MIRLHLGPHGGREFAVNAHAMAGFFRYVFPDCGCIYEGMAAFGIANLEYKGKATPSIMIPDAYYKAFASSEGNAQPA